MQIIAMGPACRRASSTTSSSPAWWKPTMSGSSPAPGSGSGTSHMGRPPFRSPLRLPGRRWNGPGSLRTGSDWWWCAPSRRIRLPHRPPVWCSRSWGLGRMCWRLISMPPAAASSMAWRRRRDFSPVWRAGMGWSSGPRSSPARWTTPTGAPASSLGMEQERRWSVPKALPRWPILAATGTLRCSAPGSAGRTAAPLRWR